MKLLGFDIRKAPAAASPSPVLPPPEPAARPVDVSSVATFAELAKIASPIPAFRERPDWQIASATEVEFGGAYADRDRISFEALRALADKADLIRLAIEDTKQTIRGLDWAIRTDDGGDADPKAELLLLKPDGVRDWDQWVSMVLEEVLVTDSTALFPWYEGGKLVRVEVIDGTTIRPLPDKDGRLPDPPEAAYEQVTRSSTPRRFSKANPDGRKSDYPPLWYLPQNSRVQSLRGYSPVEQVVLRASINLAKVLEDLDRWRNGGVPGGYIGTPDKMGAASMNLDLLQQYQRWLDDERSKPGGRSKLLAIAGNPRVAQIQLPRIDKDHEEILIRIICKAFGTDPTSLV